MRETAMVITGVVAALHVYIMVLEMFMWNRATKVFGVPRDQRDNPLLKTMLQNQGIYNGFLAAGLIWALIHPVPPFQASLALFFLACVAVAGIVGAVTADKRILFVQTVPAGLGIAAWVAA